MWEYLAGTELLSAFSTQGLQGPAVSKPVELITHEEFEQDAPGKLSDKRCGMAYPN